MLNTRTLWSKRNRVILKELVKTDYKLRYQGSVLGHLWDFIKPLMLFSVRFLVFARFFGFGNGVANFPLSLFLATILWGFFQEATTQGMTIIMNRKEMIRKAKVPGFILILSSFIGSLINLSINFLVLFIFVLRSSVVLSFQSLMLIPLLLELFLLVMGVSLILSVIYAYVRDISSLWGILLQVMMYLIPIIYPISRIVAHNERIAALLMLNPLAQIIQDARYFVLGTEAVSASQLINHPILALVPYLISPLCFAYGLLLFNKHSKKFPEIL